MRLPQLRRPSPSMAVSIFALVIATSGTSVAAAGLIDSGDVKNNTLKSGDIKNNSLKGVDIKNGSLRVKDFGDTLPAGAKGETGPAGPAGVGRWALVDATGAIIAQSGGFSVTAGYPAAPAAANGNVYINAGENLTDNGIIATIALQNTVDQNGDMIMNGRAAGPDLNPEFSGEAAVAMCQPGVVNCAPAGTGNTNHLVVSPRNSDGSVTVDGARKRFYVVVTGNSTS